MTEMNLEATLEAVRVEMEGHYETRLQKAVVPLRLEAIRWLLTNTDAPAEDVARVAGETIAAIITDIGMTASQQPANSDAVKAWEGTIAGVVITCLKEGPVSSFNTPGVPGN